MVNLLKDPDNSGEDCGRSQCRLRDKLQKKLKLQVIKKVRRLLKNCERLKRRKLQGKPRLKQVYEQLAEKRVYTNKKWRRVVFIDEKKFNLDGPDGLHYYYRDLRKEQQLPSRRSMGNGGTMIWRDTGY